MKKSIIFGGAAAAMIFAPAGEICMALSYDAPSGIELYAADIEIDREDLHGDTMVNVPIYIGSNSGFVTLKMLVQCDSRLSFDDFCELSSDTEGFAGINISESKEMENTVSASFQALSRTRFKADGEIGNVRVTIPEDIPAGTYYISIYPQDPMILTYNDFDAWFGPECFSFVGGGSITVKDRYEEAPNEQYRDDEPQQDAEPQQTEDNEDTEQAVTTAAAAVTASAVSTTIKTTAAKTSSTVTTASRSSKSTSSGTSEMVTTKTETTDVSAFAEDTAAETHNVKSKKKNMLVPAIISTVIALGTGGFIIIKGGRSK